MPNLIVILSDDLVLLFWLSLRAKSISLANDPSRPTIRLLSTPFRMQHLPDEATQRAGPVCLLHSSDAVHRWLLLDRAIDTQCHNAYSTVAHLVAPHQGEYLIILQVCLHFYHKIAPSTG
jgi:hypothetical protein